MELKNYFYFVELEKYSSEFIERIGENYGLGGKKNKNYRVCQTARISETPCILYGHDECDRQRCPYNNSHYDGRRMHRAIGKIDKKRVK